MAIFTITHRGIPIATVDLDPSQPQTVPALVSPLPAYAAIAQEVQTTSIALLFEVAALREKHPLSALLGTLGNPERRETPLGKRLELRDTMGAPVSADFIELRQLPGTTSQIHAWVAFRTVLPGRLAVSEVPEPENPESSSPAA